MPVNPEWKKKRQALAQNMRAHGLNDLANQTDADTAEIERQINEADAAANDSLRQFDTSLPNGATEDDFLDRLYELDVIANQQFSNAAGAIPGAEPLIPSVSVTPFDKY